MPLCGLVCFHGITTIVGYSKINLVYKYILDKSYINTF